MSITLHTAFFKLAAEISFCEESPRPVNLGEGRFFNVKKSACFRSEGLPSPTLHRHGQDNDSALPGLRPLEPLLF